MKEYNLSFCFKGSRDYVHGTDILNSINSLLKNNGVIAKDIDISFHNIARKNILLTEEKPKNEEIIKFVFKFKDRSNEKKFFYGIENNQNIECKYEYNEESICKLSKLELLKDEILLNENTPYSFIENIVALNKHFLENKFLNNTGGGKWYFTRLQLKQFIDKSAKIRLKFRTNFNFRLLKTEIFVDNESMGFIYFSLV